MTATVECDRCSTKYTLVPDTHVVNTFLELMTIPWYTFPRSMYDPTNRRGISTRVWTLYKGKDYCPSCWQGYQDYKRQQENKEDVDYMLEKKRQEEQQQKEAEEHDRWQHLQTYDYEKYLERVAPDVHPPAAEEENKEKDKSSGMPINPPPPPPTATPVFNATGGYTTSKTMTAAASNFDGRYSSMTHADSEKPLPNPSGDMFPKTTKPKWKQVLRLA